MNVFRSYWASVALFMAILGALLVLAEWRLERNDPTHSEFQYKALFDPNTKSDVIVVGSSTTVYGYVPTEFEDVASPICDFARFYNFGYMGAQPPFFEAWYKTLYRRYHAPPSLVIISLDWFSGGATREGDQPQLGSYRLAQDASYLPIQTWLSLFWQLDAKGRKVLLLNSLRLVRSSLDVRFLFSRRQPPQTEGSERGFMHLQSSVIGIPEGTRTFSVTSEYWKALKSFILALQEDGSSVLMVQFPTYLPERIQNFNNAHIYDELAIEMRVPYLNYNSPQYLQLQGDPSLYADWSHLNLSGALVFDRQVLRDLRRLLDQGILCH